MTATSEKSLAKFFLDPLGQQQETADFLYFIEKADPPSPSLHTNIYFSPLRTLFLSQHTNPLAIATLYSPLVCRDGLLELCHFFYSHPEPRNNVHLLIRSEFANFVPKKWRSHVGFYQYQTLKNDLAQVKDIYFLLTFAEKTHCSVSFLEKQIQTAKNTLRQNWDQCQIHVVPVSPRTSSEKPELSGEIMALYSQALHRLSQLCGPHLKSLAWSEVLKAPLAQSLVIDMNENLLHYADSYLVQHFLKEGGQVLSNKKLLPSNMKATLKLSFNHQICMSMESPFFDHETAEKVEKQMTMVWQSRTYRDEAAAFEHSFAALPEPRLKDYCSSFKSLVHHLATEYL